MLATTHSPPCLRLLLLASLMAWSLSWSPSALAAPPGPPAVEWRSLGPGLDFGMLQVEAPNRGGSARLALLRVDPERYAFKVLSGEVGDEGFSAADWRQRSGALAVFNAGQFTAQHAYLGLLIKDGQQITRPVNNMEAVFVSEPQDPDQPKARVLDLRYTPLPTQPAPFRQAAQSLMFLDRFSQVRVRRSGKVANRTLLAEDGQGRILVMISEGKHTLWDLANFMAEAGLGLREVMCMDGGAEAQLDLRIGDFAYRQTGGPGGSPDLPIPWPAAKLPAALGIFPR